MFECLHPPEVTETQVTNAMSIYGEVNKTHDEIWSQDYRSKVKTGVRLVDISLRKHIPSHMKFEGHRALLSYEGQPMTCYRCSEQGNQINGCPQRNLPGSQQISHDENLLANRVKRGAQKAPSDVSNGKNNISLSSTGEARQVIELQSRSSDQDAHDEQDPMIVEHHLCLPADEAESPSDAVNTTDNNIIRMAEELTSAPQDIQATCPNATKWSDLITTESDTERDHEKQGKKREKSQQTKDDKREDKDSDGNNTDAGSTRLTQTSSPKRTKKIKVERDVLT